MQQEQKLLSDDLTQRLNNLHNAERKKSELERELFDLWPLKAKLKEQDNQIEEIHSLKTRLDSEISWLQIQIWDLENDKTNLDAKLRESEYWYESLF